MRYRITITFFIVFLFLLAGCGEEDTQIPLPESPAPIETSGSGETDNVEAPEETAPPEPTEIPPSPTPVEPLAAVVNDQPIYLVDFERELARYERAQLELGLESEEGPSIQEIVLDALIEKELIAQAAESMGLTITLEMVDQRILELEEASGGSDRFNTWLQTNQWTIDEFKSALMSEITAEKAVEVITVDVPAAVEQVQARYLQVDDQALAEAILAQIRGGSDFADLAQEHSLDRLTGENGGDLGYFARGSLLVPEVEAAAFQLQPGETSEIITGSRADGVGTVYYIVQVTNRDPERLLNADLRFKFLQEKFQNWLEEQWLLAQITRYIEPNG
jgi:parvulin-like peptidyl-prolyl isomerase